MLICVAALGIYAAVVGDYKISAALMLVMVMWPFV
jgi:hypothetical protein